MPFRKAPHRGSRRGPALLLAAVCLLAYCLCVPAACDFFFPWGPDDELPQHYEPVAWNDNLVFLAVNDPCRVQIWDTASRTLVRQYEYPSTNLLYIEDMAVSGERFWAVMVGNQRQLIQVNAATGEWKKIDLDILPINIGYAGEYLWVFTLPNPREGVYVRQLNRDGELVRSLHIRQEGFETIDDNGIVYVNGEYLVNAKAYFTTRSDEYLGKIFLVINLSRNEGEAVATVPEENIFPPGFLEETVYDDWLLAPHPSCGSIYFHGDSLAEKAYISSELVWRWFCGVESYDPLRLSAPLVTVHQDGDRSNFYVSRTEQNIFIAGRLLTQLSAEPDYNGLEVGVYPADGGDEIKAMRMWESNQITYARKNGEVWFGKNLWTQNPDFSWDRSGKPEAYVLDETNARLYRVSADGTSVEISPVRVHTGP
jgi:hypothetical protein